MKKQEQVGEWSFELKQVFCRKATEHGEPFSASAVITIANGQPHIELMLNSDSDKLGRQDYRAFSEFLSLAGFTSSSSKRIKNKCEIELIHTKI